MMWYFGGFSVVVVALQLQHRVVVEATSCRVNKSSPPKPRCFCSFMFAGFAGRQSEVLSVLRVSHFPQGVTASSGRRACRGGARVCRGGASRVSRRGIARWTSPPRRNSWPRGSLSHCLRQSAFSSMNKIPTGTGHTIRNSKYEGDSISSPDAHLDRS